MHSRASSICATLVMLFCLPLCAQRMIDRHPSDVVGTLSPPPGWGTNVASAVSIVSYGFQSVTSGANIADDGNGYRYCTGFGATFIAPVHVPSGARITNVAIDYCDTSVAGNFEVFLYDSYGDHLFSTIADFIVPDR